MRRSAPAHYRAIWRAPAREKRKSKHNILNLGICKVPEGQGCLKDNSHGHTTQPQEFLEFTDHVEKSTVWDTFLNLTFIVCFCFKNVWNQIVFAKQFVLHFDIKQPSLAWAISMKFFSQTQKRWNFLYLQTYSFGHFFTILSQKHFTCWDGRSRKQNWWVDGQS